MSMPLFDAKIHPTSALTHIVLRPKIIARLNEVDHWRLAVITAPVGYGKTTLLHQWIKDAAVNTAYLSLDGDDNNQDQFIAYIIKSLNNMNSRIGVGLMKSGELMPSVPPGEILLMLVKQLNSLIHEPYALVLDNYNLINNPLITELISMLMKNTTDKFHLVISSREVPPIPLARPRVQGILLEIQQVDLSFSLEETRDFLAHSIDIKLPTETISALHKRTEGWIAGLQIAAISVRNRPEDKIITALDSFSGIPRDIRDYI
jgi:LuxR family maltose regulon positive regulatory protein